MPSTLKDLDQQVYCVCCNGKRNHKVIDTYEEKSKYDDEFRWHVQYHIVKCAGCNRIAFVKQYGDEDSWEYTEDGEREWVDTFKVYPEEPKEEGNRKDIWDEQNKIEVKKFSHTPEIIVNLYKQIIESYNNKHFILCTSGLRTLVEGICEHQGIKKGYIYDEDKKIVIDDKGNDILSTSLGGRIFGLYEKGNIVFTQALILQKVKLIGNNAIHQIVVPDMGTIKEIIIILERVMEDIYELENHKLLKK